MQSALDHISRSMDDASHKSIWKLSDVRCIEVTHCSNVTFTWEQCVTSGHDNTPENHDSRWHSLPRPYLLIAFFITYWAQRWTWTTLVEYCAASWWYNLRDALLADHFQAIYNSVATLWCSWYLKDRVKHSLESVVLSRSNRIHNKIVLCEFAESLSVTWRTPNTTASPRKSVPWVRATSLLRAPANTFGLPSGRRAAVILVRTWCIPWCKVSQQAS